MLRRSWEWERCRVEVGYGPPAEGAAEVVAADENDPR